jgi:large subunit ribosomal protein L13
MKNKITTSYNPIMKDVKRSWHYFDAEGMVLGKLAADVAKILIGKNKATFTPNEDLADNVVISNAEKITVTGKKLTDKIYYHTGFPKGLRAENLQSIFDRKPTDVLRKAVMGMLPKNKLRAKRINHLYIYVGTEHPHKQEK